MIASAKRAFDARRAADLGVHVSGDVRVDLAAVVARKDAVVESIRSGSYKAVGRSGDLDFIEGHGRMVAGRRLQVGDRTIKADRIFLNATPSHPSMGLTMSTTSLPVRSWTCGSCPTSRGGRRRLRPLRVRADVRPFRRPRHGGVRGERLLPGEDPDISAAVEQAFTDEGIDGRTGTSCVAVAPADRRIRVACHGDAADELVASHLLIATGRTAGSDELGLEYRDLAPDDRGFLAVGDSLHAHAEDVWVLGDLRGGAMFTHAARDDVDRYRTVFKGQDRSIAARVVPHVVSCGPEVASVGLTAQQAREAGHVIAVGRQEFTGVAGESDQPDGRVHPVRRRRRHHRVLGCHIVGPDAGNLIHEAVIAMVADAPYSDIGRAIHIHPTLAEGVNAAAGSVHQPSSD